MHLLEETGEDIVSRHGWAGLTTEATHTTIANENQGAITTIAPGYDYIKNSTLWDRTEQLPAIGPLNSIDWQVIKSSPSTGVSLQFRLRGGNLLVSPVPTAGHTLAFEYQSNNWILDVNGTTTKNAFTADTDTFRIPELLLLVGLRWRWSAEKGLAYGELFNTYEHQIKEAIGRDGGQKVLSSDNSFGPSSPGIFISNGSWI